LALLGLSACSVINKQYYYEPSIAHQSVSDRHSYFKMTNIRFKVLNKAGDSIATVSTNNGIGQPLLIGPVIFPVIPIGVFFHKRATKFEMTVNINSSQAYFMPLAIDSIGHQHIRDSLKSANISKIIPLKTLKTKDCYIIVNDSLKVPLCVYESFIGSNVNHQYVMRSDIRFRKIKTMRLVTGNALLDSTFRNMIFKRRQRITFNLLGGS